jgi:hypothetical protein
MNYLEEAAKLLRDAAAENEKMHDTSYAYGKANRNEGRIRIATLYAGLAAIDKGVSPVGLFDAIMDAAQDNR